jgi:hypothetical protein
MGLFLRFAAVKVALLTRCPVVSSSLLSIFFASDVLDEIPISRGEAEKGSIHPTEKGQRNADDLGA